MDQITMLRRYPRIIAHMIAESLGYFTPKAAANALLAHKMGEPFHCEMYVYMAGSYGDEEVRKAGEDFLKLAIRNRRWHNGYMSSYKHARRLVEADLEGCGPVLASWF
ncbi:MAG: hypothetical protein J7M34_05880 [Anaerolineae bacterium]|nr:hypothetical protein [Anaerolineae bacterium]